MSENSNRPEVTKPSKFKVYFVTGCWLLNLGLASGAAYLSNEIRKEVKSWHDEDGCFTEYLKTTKEERMRILEEAQELYKCREYPSRTSNR